MTDSLPTRIAKVLCDLYERKCCDECDVNRIEFNYREYLDDADAVIRELNTNCVGYQIWKAAEWISANSGWVPYEIHRNADGSGGGWRVTVQRIEANDD